jgi:hypothetical protein
MALEQSDSILFVLGSYAGHIIFKDVAIEYLMMTLAKNT